MGIRTRGADQDGTERSFTRRDVLRSGLGLAGAFAVSPALLAAGGSAVAPHGSLTWSRGDDIRTQDPQLISGLMEGTISRILYDPLLDVDAKGNQVKVLATSATMSPDGKSYTFKLRDGVRFHDGSPFNADAVVFTYQRLLSNPTFQTASPFVGVVSDIEAKDPRTVVFHLTAPNPGLITSFNQPILAPSAYKKYGAEFYKYGIGTGPFKFVSWTPNVSWVGTANTNYWVKGLVKLQKITFRSIAEDATRVAALQNGEVDIVDSLSGDEATQLASDGGVKVARAAATNEIALTFNMKRAPFSNKDARWAVAYAINKETIVKNILKEGKLAGASIPPGTVGYDAKLFKSIIPYNMNKAKQSLAAAGVKPGTKISFKLNPAWFANMQNVAEYIQNQLQKLGFTVTLQFLEPGAYTEARKSGDFDICVQEIGRANNPDTNFTILYVDSAFGNFYKEINPKIVPMIENARTQLSYQARNTAYQKIQQVLAEDIPELILYQEGFVWGVRNRVTNFQPRSDEETRVYGCGVKAGA